MDVVCPECGNEVRTRTVRKLSDEGFTRFLILLRIACFAFPPLICCVCIPFCMDSMHETSHFCPKCNKKIGTKK